MPANRKPKAWNLKPQMTAAPELWRGCQIFHPLWEGSGDPFSAKGPNGVMPSTPPTWIIGANGRALSFDESDDYYSISDTPELTVGTEFTLAFMLRIPDNSGSDFQYFYSYGNAGTTPAVNIFTVEDSDSSGGVFRARVEDSGGAIEQETDSVAPFTDWKILTIRRPGSGSSNIEVLLDGVNINTTDNIGGNPGAIDRSDSLNIGRRVDADANRYYGGEIAWWSKWNRYLPDADVKALADFAMLRPAGF